MLPGIRSSNIGKFTIRNSTCVYCNNKNSQKISVFGKYIHISWIPFFPIYKKVIVECSNCKEIISRKKFSQNIERQYQENRILIKKPLWHWTGTIISFVLLTTLIIIGETTHVKKDYRRNLFYADENLMITNPSLEKDPVSNEIKRTLDSYVIKEINPSSFKYLTKIKENKALILVQIPKLKKVDKEYRIEILNQIESITNNHQLLKNKSIYIGIKGIWSMMVIKTPNYERNSKLSSSSNLYNFYESEPIPIDALKKTNTIETKNPENN